jgi:hypothetical protein
VGKRDDHTELIVLLAMADFADDAGYCFPSVSTLAKKSRISQRQALRVIQHLCDKQWIELVEKGGVRNGRNVSNRYRILLVLGGTDTMSPHGHSRMRVTVMRAANNQQHAYSFSFLGLTPCHPMV